MNVSRINYLFAEPEFDTTRDLYRAVLVAACKSASQKAKGYNESLTHFTNEFDLDDLVSQMPVVESATGQLKPKYSLVCTLAAIRFLDKAGYIGAGTSFEWIMLETHLFKMIAEAWSISMGVQAFPAIMSDELIYATSAKRAGMIEGYRIGRLAGKEAVAA
jgi:hypothetical protein